MDAHLRVRLLKLVGQKTADAGKKKIASCNPLFFLPIACT